MFSQAVKCWHGEREREREREIEREREKGVREREGGREREREKGLREREREGERERGLPSPRLSLVDGAGARLREGGSGGGGGGGGTIPVTKTDKSDEWLPDFPPDHAVSGVSTSCIAVLESRGQFAPDSQAVCCLV